MEENDQHINYKKSDKPVVPENFFQNFQEELFAKIDEQHDDLGLVKSEKPALPAMFFDEFQEKVLDKIDDEKVKPLFSRKLIYITGSIAAILIIGILVFPYLLSNEGNKNLVSEVVIDTTITDEEEIDAYLAIIDESTLVDYYVEEDIELIDEHSESEDNDALIDFIGTDFEDIYYDL